MLTRTMCANGLEAASDKLMAEKLEAFGPETMRNIEKQVLLQTIDAKWREHLLTAGAFALGCRDARLCTA